jgi:hypothetical protein
MTQISELLEKYWEGETTLDEERRLKEYFASGPVAAEHCAFAPLFAALRDEKALQMQLKAPVAQRPQPYQWRGWAAAAALALLLLSSALVWWRLRDAQPSAPRHAATPPAANPAPPAAPETPALAEAATPPPTAERSTSAPHPRRKIRVNQKPAPPDPAAEQAMQEIKAALALVSTKLGKGRREATKGTLHLENIDRVIKKKNAREG